MQLLRLDNKDVILRLLGRLFIIFMGVLYSINFALANPQGGNIVAGNATIYYQGNYVQINQLSDKAIIDWQSFNININEHTHFEQNSSSSIALNRISGISPSSILGKLTATGQVMLINPAGIVFGQGAQVDVGGLLATTANITNQNFLDGNYQFTNAGNGAIINYGHIKVSDYGFVALVAPGVENHGIIEANLGRIALGAGTAFTLDLYGDDLIHIAVGGDITEAAVDSNGNKLKNGVLNTGLLKADGGKILVTAKALNDVVENVINMQGIVQANAVSHQGGVIVLHGGSVGRVRVAANIQAKGLANNQSGGTVHILGEDIHVLGNTMINVSGGAGGGEVLIGGGYQGLGYLMHAKRTIVDVGASILADALYMGDGGKIIVWSDDYTEVHGIYSAQGGPMGGNGGLVETSSKTFLEFSDLSVNTSALHGVTGLWLLDPTNIIIDQMKADDIAGMLAMNNVTLKTSDPGGDVGDIVFMVGVSLEWASNNILNLIAHNDIVFNINSYIRNTGGGKLILDANSDASPVVSGVSGGKLIFHGLLTPLATSLGGQQQVIFTNGGEVIFYYSPDVFPVPINYNPNVKNPSGTFTPYMLVVSVSDLQSINNNNINFYYNYAFGKDLDAAGFGNFTPLGTIAAFFHGIFDGRGYEISNIVIDEPTQTGFQMVGLFSGNGGIIKNIGMRNAYVKGGGIVGGLVGMNWTEVINSYYIGTVESTETATAVGGLVGINEGWLRESFAMGIVTSTAQSAIGGYTDLYVGGLAGFNFGKVKSSFAVSYVYGNHTDSNLGVAYVGGLVGASRPLGGGPDFIKNSYSMGVVSGGSNSILGGLVGLNQVEIINSYSTSYIDDSSAIAAGGFIGQNDVPGWVNGSFWDTSTSGLMNAVGIGSPGDVTGLPTSAMQDPDTFFNAGWSTSMWGVIDGVSYPYHQWLFPTPPQIISGFVYSNPFGGGTTVGGGELIRLVAGGEFLGFAYTGDNGFYYIFLANSLTPILPNAIASAVAADKALIVYAPTAIMGNTVYLSDGGNVTNLDIWNNYIIARSDTAAPISNKHFSDALGSFSDSGILFNISQVPLFHTIEVTTPGITFATSTLAMGGFTQNYVLNGSILMNEGIMHFSSKVTLDTSSLLDSDWFSVGSGIILFEDVITGAHVLTLRSGDTIKIKGDVTITRLNIGEFLNLFIAKNVITTNGIYITTSYGINNVNFELVGTQDQLLDGGMEKVIVNANILKTGSGLLTIAGINGIDINGGITNKVGGIHLKNSFAIEGHILADMNDIIFDMDGILDGLNDQVIEAFNGTIHAKSTLHKMNGGDLSLAAFDTIDLDNKVTVDNGSLILKGFADVAHDLMAQQNIHFLSNVSFTGTNQTMTTMSGDFLVDGTVFKANGLLDIQSGRHVHLASTVDGAFDLLITANNGDVEIYDVIGGINPLSSVTITAINIDLPSVTTQGDQMYTASNKTTMQADHFTNGGMLKVVGLLDILDEVNVHTMGGHIFLDTATVTLNHHLSLHASAGDIHLGMIDGPHNLILNSDGTTFLKDLHGSNMALLNIVTDAGGTTVINADIFTQGTAMIFNDNVILGNNVTLTDLGGAGIFFNKSLIGQFALILNVNGGNVLFNTVNIGDLNIMNVNNVTFLGLANVKSYHQGDGTGTTNFGTAGLMSDSTIFVRTDFIWGLMVADAVDLKGVSGVGSLDKIAFIFADQLDVGGQSGGFMLGGIKNDFTGEAAKIVGKLSGSNGLFLFNHCEIVVGCPVDPPVFPPDQIKDIFAVDDPDNDSRGCSLDDEDVDEKNDGSKVVRGDEKLQDEEEIEGDCPVFAEPDEIVISEAS